MTDIFIDTGDVDAIRQAQGLGVIDGCTTNPKILSSIDRDFEELMREILDLVDGPVSIEVTSNEEEEMVEQARRFDSWGDNAVVKLPMNVPGLRATNTVGAAGVDVNVTACMAPNQALLAAKAGARYASIFMGRVGDMGYDAETVIRDAVQLLDPFDTELIVGSIRKAYDVNRAFLAGADVVTVPPGFLENLVDNPRTESSIDEFLEFWADR